MSHGKGVRGKKHRKVNLGNRYPDREVTDPVDVARAAAAFVRASDGDPAAVMAGFLGAFEPNMPDHLRRSLISDARASHIRR